MNNSPQSQAKVTAKLMGSRWVQFFPILATLQHYTNDDFKDDLIAGIITAILLVPQGIAYAMLAGLPPQVGLYASILPPAVYALLGTSRTLSVGPVSIAAIMIASALSAPEIQAFGDPVQMAIVLSMEASIILLTMSLFRMGSLVNFISHPVLTGFTTGAAVLIIFSQLSHLLGLPKKLDCGWNVPCYFEQLSQVSTSSFSIGLASIILLIVFGKPLSSFLQKFGLSKTLITGITKCGPLIVIVLGTLVVMNMGLKTQGVATVGHIPSGLPELKLGILDYEIWKLLLTPALFIALIAYVESVAIAKVTANLRRQRINPNQELIALGGANFASSISGSMPVAGGFSRTMVNFSAGAKTQVAMLIAAALLALSVIFFSSWFEDIPKAGLAAIILIAIWPLVRLREIITTWRYDQGDGFAEILTFFGVLTFGIEAGLAIGIILTLLTYLWRTSHPHIAVIGRVAGTEHFRNICRHEVETWPSLLMIRIDENLTFANTGYVEDFIASELVKHDQAQNLVLICTAISHIDATALEMLENLIISLNQAGVTLHLAEVKGPVMDKLEQSSFLEKCQPGKIYFRTDEAVADLIGS